MDSRRPSSATVWNTELFRVYTLSTGALVNTVAPAIDTLTATYSSETWTAGAVTPFTLTFTSALHPGAHARPGTCGGARSTPPSPSAATGRWPPPIRTSATAQPMAGRSPCRPAAPACTASKSPRSRPAGSAARCPSTSCNDVVEIRPSGARGRHQRLHHHRRRHGGHRRDHQRQRERGGHRHQLHHHAGGRQYRSSSMDNTTPSRVSPVIRS